MLCARCSRDFQTQRGLDQHERRMHPRPKFHMRIEQVEITQNGKRVGYLKHAEWSGTGTPPLAELFSGLKGGD